MKTKVKPITVDEPRIKTDKQNVNYWMVFCGCGCGKQRSLFDRDGNMRRYIKGHAMKGL